MKRLLVFIAIGFLMILLAGCGNTSTVVEEVEVTGNLEEDIIGDWEATLDQEVSAVDNETTSDIVVTYSFKDDGTVEETVLYSETGVTDPAEIVVTGTYKVSGDDVEITVKDINGMTEEDYLSSNADLEDELKEFVSVLYQSEVYTAEIEDDLLILSNEDGSLELTRI